MVLEKIHKENDIKNLSPEELTMLADEIRQFLIEKISVTGGHLASNLGVVELTMALHLVFDLPQDKLIWDVGHQAYTHKLLTGRKAGFDELRKYGGMSGFPKRKESECDAFDTGHSSTSISAGLGYVAARELQGGTHSVVSIIGDGSMTGGMAYEALNNASRLKSNFIIVLNDNNMSISENVGGMSQYLNGLRTAQAYTGLKKGVEDTLKKIPGKGDRIIYHMKRTKSGIKQLFVPGMFFEDMGITYLGPVDGHDIHKLTRILNEAKRVDHAVLVHVMTKKGKGYPYAENDKEGYWHGVSQFDPVSGQPLAKLPSGHCSWSEVISRTLCDLARKDKDIVAITPAMKSGSKLSNFANEFPDRFFDCGIAEEHAATFAAGLAINGKRPFLSIYSSFLQRAYDQVNHDIARMDLPVVIGIDRCGLVGEDGATHHGVFDITMLHSVPNLILAQPKDSLEAKALLKSAFSQRHPFCIRYPRGNVPYDNADTAAAEIGTWTRWRSNDHVKVCVITYGSDVDRIIAKAQANDLPLEVINARFFKPMDEQMLDEILYRDIPTIVYESDMLDGGLSAAILQYINDHGIEKHLIRMGIKDHFVEQGSVAQLRKAEKIDINSLFRKIERLLSCD